MSSKNIESTSKLSLRSYFTLYFIYNFSRVIFLIPEQGLLYFKTCSVNLNFHETFCIDIFLDRNKSSNDTIIHNVIMENVSSITFSINLLINFTFLLFCPMMLLALKHFRFQTLFYSSMTAKIILNINILLFIYLDISSHYFILVYAIPSLLGDDIVFFTTFNKYLSKIIFSANKSEVKERKQFSSSLIYSISGRMLAYLVNNIFFLTNNYFLIYSTFLFINILCLVSMIIISKYFLKEISTLEPDTENNILDFYQTIKKNLKLLLKSIKIIAFNSFPPLSIIEKFIFLYVAIKFNWTEKFISLYKILEALTSIAILFCFDKVIKKLDFSVKNIIIITEVSILISFILLPLFDFELIVLISIFFYLFVNVYNNELKRLYFKNYSEEENNYLSPIIFSFLQNLFFLGWSLLFFILVRLSVNIDHIFYSLIAFESIIILISLKHF